MIEEIEVGHQFITCYSKKLPELLELAKKLYTLLPKELQALQRVNLVHIPGDPNIFHTFGQPNDFRKHYRHFHIIYPNPPSQENINEILNILDKHFGINGIDVTDWYMFGIYTKQRDNRSKRLLQKWLEVRSETIDELLLPEEKDL